MRQPGQIRRREGEFTTIVQLHLQFDRSPVTLVSSRDGECAGVEAPDGR